jgi:hypothetical protein
VSFYSDNYWVVFWPNPTSADRSAMIGQWSGGVAVFARWLGDVRKDHEAPALWAELAKARTSPGFGEAQLRPFSEGELKQLEAGLDDLQNYVLQNQPLDPEGQRAAKGRFAYLKDAAKAGVRKIDCWNILVSQMVSLATEHVIQPSFTNPSWRGR